MVVELQEHVKRAIAPYKYPRIIEFVDSLPRTHTGKLQRYKLRPAGAQPALGKQAVEKAAPGRAASTKGSRPKARLAGSPR
jgi:acyl-coenzyme A synthetase/AMP-(fatty) acid ligase